MAEAAKHHELLGLAGPLVDQQLVLHRAVAIGRRVVVDRGTSSLDRVRKDSAQRPVQPALVGRPQRRGKAEKQVVIQGSALTNTHPVKAELPLRLKSPSSPWPTASWRRIPGQPGARTTGIGPAGGFVMHLSEVDRLRLRDRLRATLPTRADGSIQLVARAWAVRGLAP